MQRLITQPVPVTVSGRRARLHRPPTSPGHGRVAAGTTAQHPTVLRAARLALGVLLAFALLGLLGVIDNVVSASADGSHHPVSQRAELMNPR